MTDLIAPGNKRVAQRRSVRKDGITKAKRKLFLDTLAGTCNVKYAARATKISACSFYNLRRRDPEFASLWRDAVALGYEVLEEALLGRAISELNAIVIEPVVDFPADPAPVDAAAVNGSIDAESNAVAPSVAKSDPRLGLMLLGRHQRGRSSASGRTKMSHAPRATLVEVIEAIDAKLDKLAKLTKQQKSP